MAHDLGVAVHVRLGEGEAHGFDRFGLVVLDPDQDPLDPSSR